MQLKAVAATLPGELASHRLAGAANMVAVDACDGTTHALVPTRTCGCYLLGSVAPNLAATIDCTQPDSGAQ
jgi:hypothetical protein